MTQFYSRIDTELKGDVYNIPFSYIKESEISVFINDEAISDWEFLNESQIKILTFPQNLPSNSIVTIKRNTDINQKVVDYSNQSMLKQENLNLSQDQLLNAVQEIYDNNIKFEIDTTQTIKDNQEETIDILEENRQEILDTLEENRQEILGIQDTYEQESDAKFVAYQDELNTKFETVAEAANRINNLDNELAIVTNAANEAVSQAQIATQQAEIATNKADEILNVKDELEAELDTKANTDLTNLSELGEKHFLNKSQTTNCLLEVPQNIKLELNNGILTLKTGSTVVVPNGANNFAYTQNTKDLSRSAFQTNTDENVYILCLVDETTNIPKSLSFCDSHVARYGTEPVAGNYYHTTNNTLHNYNSDGSTADKRSFPIALVSMENGTVTRIKKVFNSGGNFSNVLFTHIGTKLLYPNGFENGQLKNIERTVTETKTLVIENTYPNVTYFIQLRDDLNYLVRDYVTRVVFDIKEPSHPVAYLVWYNLAENKCYQRNGDNTSWTVRSRCPFGYCKTDENGNVVDFETFSPLQIADANKTVSKYGDTMQGDLWLQQNINSYFGIQLHENLDCNSLVAPTGTHNYGGRIAFVDKNNQHHAWIQTLHNTGNQMRLEFGSRRYIDSVSKISSACLYVDDKGISKFSFPKCTTKPTTVSSATNDLACYVVQNYLNGNSWYRVWSDGFCEQGGILTYTHTQRFQAGDVTLLKPLKTVVSKLACSIDQVGSSGVSTIVTNVDQDITSASDQLNKIRICVERLYDSSVSVSGKVYWEVKGFIN